MTITANMTTTIPTVDLMSQKLGRTVAADATGILTITALQRMSKALHRNITTAIVMAVQLVTAAVTATDRRVRHARILVSDLPVPWSKRSKGSAGTKRSAGSSGKRRPAGLTWSSGKYRPTGSSRRSGSYRINGSSGNAG